MYMPTYAEQVYVCKYVATYPQSELRDHTEKPCFHRQIHNYLHNIKYARTYICTVISLMKQKLLRM